MPRERSSRSTKLLNRMRRFDFEFIVPQRTRLSAVEPVLEDIHALREHVFREWGSLPDQSGLTHEYSVDGEAYHVVVRVQRRLVGCIRFIVFDEPAASAIPDRVLTNSGCVFSDSDRALCIAALREYFAGEAFGQGPLIQFGGLVVARDVRRTGVAPVLCLAGVAFARLVGSQGGISFAAEKSAGTPLYQKTGAFPLGLGTTALQPLDDMFHRDRVTVLGSSPWLIAPDLEEIVLALKARLAPTLHDHRAAYA